MSENEPQVGRDEHRVRRALSHDEEQTAGAVVQEDEGVFEIDLSGLPPIRPEAVSHHRLHIRGGDLVERKLLMEDVTDPVEIARARAQRERARRNSQWLQAHWPELLPAARGKFVAVAGQEAFIADSAEEAWAMARAAHPDDDGAIDQYVRPERGPRIYAIHR